MPSRSPRAPALRRGETAAPVAAEHGRALAALRARFGLDRLEHALTAAAPFPPEVHEFFLALGLPFAEFYGMTEIGAATMTRPEPRDIGTVGRAVPSFELRLADDGEVLVRGPAVTPGYHGRADATAALIDRQGRLHTGDVGTLDATAASASSTASRSSSSPTPVTTCHPPRSRAASSPRARSSPRPA